MFDLVRPFLPSGLGGEESTTNSAAPNRFYEHPQPLVAGHSTNDASGRLLDALRTQPATGAVDERISVADLTLIAMASATEQVAASPAGTGPVAAPAPSRTAAAAVTAASQAGEAAQDIEALARAAFDELKRLIAIAGERSGEHG